MADTAAPAVEKVELPAPSAPESTAQAAAAPETSSFKPTSAPPGPAIPGLTATASPVVAPAAPADPTPEKTAPPVEEKKLEHSAGGAGPALSAPKPVEVMSVPDTPMNGSTPAGGTPRPELDIPTEKIEIPKPSDAQTGDVQKTTTPAVTTGVQEPTSAPAVSAPKEDPIPESIKDVPSGAAVNGKPSDEAAEKAGAIQAKEHSTPAQPPTLKRKFDDEPTDGVNGDGVPDSQPAEKKVKLDGSTPTENTNGHSKPADKSEPATTGSSEQKESEKPNGRAKRGMGKRAKKIAEAIVGKTARKTRSQGPA